MIRTGRSPRPLQEAAAGVQVVGLDRRLDLLQRHLVFLKFVGIDKDLILLDVAAHDDDLGDAGQLQEPGTHQPVGCCPQVHPLFQGVRR
jgi:hypothetical protein